MPKPTYTRRPVSIYDRAALGVYKGPPRRVAPPRLTVHRRRVLDAIANGKVHVGKGRHAAGFRWNDSGAMTTVTRTVNEFIACGWAHVVGAHVELTDAGRKAMTADRGALKAAVLKAIPDGTAIASYGDADRLADAIVDAVMVEVREVGR